jgi:CHAD domain-containing protein
VRAHLLTQTRRLILNDVRLRRGLPDAVHQMRVAARRLRSGLRTFRPLLEREWADELRTELAWLANELGAVRDTEVLLDRLDRHAGLLADPVLAERVRPLVDAALGERLDAATAEALASLSSPRYLALLDRAVEAAVKPWFTPVASEPGRDVLPHLARKSWRELRRDAEQLEIDGPAEIWHETRIIAKRARYAAEALEPVFGKPATALAGHLEEVTELLGEHQDAHVSRLVLREIAERPGLDGLDGFALGALRDLEDDAELEARLRFVRLWPRVVRAHRRTRIG